jgi:3,4-dihydroxy 2-butanone 4-phosphate synthase/GTP cyclohydrolase II
MTRLARSPRRVAGSWSTFAVTRAGASAWGTSLQAYNLQDDGLDTVDANLRLGLPVDSREYGIGAQILIDLGVERMRLMTNNPAKYAGLKGYGLEIIERVAMPLRITSHNLEYLRTKRERMGHLLDGPTDVDHAR